MARWVAALFVEDGGCYFGLRGVDPWPKDRDARFYRGPHPIVAHPPCERWGRYYGGAPRKPHQYVLGDDGGLFASALISLLLWGGVLEHPAHSRAWEWFDLPKPDRHGGWLQIRPGLWTAHVEQGHYGHFSRKPTWLLANGLQPPDLVWGPAEQRLPAYAVERYGYAKARRIGVMAAVGGKDKTRIRARTPVGFRDLLLLIARNGLV